MAKSYEILLNIGGKLAGSLTKSTENASKSLQNIQKSAEKTSKSMEFLKHATEAFAGYEGIKKMIEIGKDFMDSSNEAATAAQRLNATMSNVKGTTQEQIESIAKYSDALEKNTTISHIANETGASQLATFGMHADAIKKLLPSLDNLAVGTYGVNVSQEQMQSSANILGKVMAGNGTALKRMGIMLDKNQTNLFKNGTEAQKTALLMQLLGKKYGNMAEKMAQTPAGRIKQLNNAWDEVKETIGAKLTPVVIAALAVISKNIPGIEKAMMGVVNTVTPAFNFIKDTIIPGLGTAFKMAGGMASWLGKNIKIVIPIIAGLAAAVGYYKTIQMLANKESKAAMMIASLSKAWKTASVAIALLREGESLAAVTQLLLNGTMLANPAVWVALGIGTLIGVIVLLVTHWKKVCTAVSDAWNWFQHLIKGMPDVALALTGPIAPLLLLIKHFDAVKKAVGGAFDTVKNFFGLGGSGGADASGGNGKGTSVSKTRGLSTSIPKLTKIPKLANGGIVSHRSGGIIANIGEGKDDEAVIPLKKGMGGGGTVITWAPQIILKGNASKADVKQALDESQRDFERKMKAYERSKKRVSFA